MGTICLFKIADLEQKLFPETCYTAELRGVLQTCKQFALKGKNGVCEFSSTHCLEIHRPKQEEWRVVEACKSTNITFGKIPVISRGLSRAGPGKILLQCLITRSASQAVAGLLGIVRE